MEFVFSLSLPTVLSPSPMSHNRRVVCPGVPVVLFIVITLIPDPMLYIIEYIEPRVVWRRKRQLPSHRKPKIALTIDDAPYIGPNNNQRGISTVNEILDVLKQFNVKATFMIMSHENGQEWEGDAIKRIVAEGHELGNHGIADEAMWRLSQSDFVKRFDHCDKYITKLNAQCNERVDTSFKWFRPGYGFWTKGMLKYVQSRGYTTVLANVYPLFEMPLYNLGFSSLNSSLCAEYLIYHARAGGIMLLHDRKHTPEALRLALPTIVQQYNVCSLTGMMCNDDNIQ